MQQAEETYQHRRTAPIQLALFDEQLHMSGFQILTQYLQERKGDKLNTSIVKHMIRGSWSYINENHFNKLNMRCQVFQNIKTLYQTLSILFLGRHFGQLIVN